MRKSCNFDSFEQSLSNIMNWIDSKNQNGAYIGCAHHPIWGVINDTQLPHTFSYYGIIEGYINLYKKFGEQMYLDRAKAAGDFLCTLQRSSGQYRYDTFEFNTGKNRGRTLIHNVLPSCSLVSLAVLSKDKRYFRVAKRNIIWAWSVWWNGKYLSGCVNQDMCASEAIASLYLLEKKDVYLKRARRIADSCLDFQINEGEMKGGFIRGVGERNLVIPWYDAKTALSYYNLFKITGEERYLESAKDTCLFLKKCISDKGLIHWYCKRDGWERIESPYLIAPIGVVLYLFEKLGMKYRANVPDFQSPDGSFPSASGFNDYRDNRPVLGWNQFMFLFLSEKVKKKLPGSEVSDFEVASKTLPVVLDGEVRGFGEMSGFVDIIKDNIVRYAGEVRDGRFEIRGRKGEYTLRVRVDNARWKCLKVHTSRRFSYVHVWNLSFFWPYFAFNSILTALLKLCFYNDRVFDNASKIRLLKMVFK